MCPCIPVFKVPPAMEHGRAALSAMVAVEEVCGCARGWEGPHVAMDSTWIPQDLENELLCGGQISQNISGFRTHNQLV